jgi:hypothetical protein
MAIAYWNVAQRRDVIFREGLPEGTEIPNSDCTAWGIPRTTHKTLFPMLSRTYRFESAWELVRSMSDGYHLLVAWWHDEKEEDMERLEDLNLFLFRNKDSTAILAFGVSGTPQWALNGEAKDRLLQPTMWERLKYSLV